MFRYICGPGPCAEKCPCNAVTHPCTRVGGGRKLCKLDTFPLFAGIVPAVRRTLGLVAGVCWWNPKYMPTAMGGMQQLCAMALHFCKAKEIQSH